MRDAKLSTSVTSDEKQAFREIAAADGKTMSEKLRDLVYEELERNDHLTSETVTDPNRTTAASD